MTISPKKIKIDRIKNIILGIAVITIFAVSISYAYFVNQAVLNVVEREKLDKEIANLTSRIGEMERQYIEVADEIDKDLAYNRGYREAENTTFISRKPQAERFSLEE